MRWGDPNEFYRGGSDEESLEIDLDSAFDGAYRLLGDHRRRALLYLLAEGDAQIHPVESLASQLARLEDTTDITDVSVELRHKHLPKLADTGIIEYDARSEAVVYLGDERVETLLGPAMEYELLSK